MNDPNHELAIRQLVAEYADGVNRYDPPTWAATWAEQGKWLLRPDETVTGRKAIVQQWQSIMETLEFAIMLPGSGQVRIEGNGAAGRWYMTEVVQEKPGQGRQGGAGAHIVGVYNDEYLLCHGRWHFLKRAYHLLYRTPTDPRAEHTPLAINLQIF